MRLSLPALCITVLLLGGCGADAEARALAAHTCKAVESADANPGRFMLEGFDMAEAAGVSEGAFRDALVEECGMEPPPRARLDKFAPDSSEP